MPKSHSYNAAAHNTKKNVFCKIVSLCLNCLIIIIIYVNLNLIFFFLKKCWPIFTERSCVWTMMWSVCQSNPPEDWSATQNMVLSSLTAIRWNKAFRVEGVTEVERKACHQKHAWTTWSEHFICHYGVSLSYVAIIVSNTPHNEDM